MVLGPKYFNMNGIRELYQHHLGPWTLRGRMQLDLGLTHAFANIYGCHSQQMKHDLNSEARASYRLRNHLKHSRLRKSYG